MKICWDNLEGVHLTRNGVFVKGYNSYVYKDSCVECSEPYLTLKYKQSRFCDRSCSLKRRVFSEETKQKMVEAWKKRAPVSEETRQKQSKARKGKFTGKNGGMYGKRHSEEAKRKMSVARKGNKYALGTKCSDETKRKLSVINTGGLNANWKGGVAEKKLPLFDTYAHQIDYAHEVRPVIKDGVKLLEVRCKNCNNWFIPKTSVVQSRIGVLDGRNNGEHNFYCSEKCKNSCSVFYQKLWPKDYKPYEVNKSIWYTTAELKIWREEVLKRADYKCEYCGEKATIAHHSKPKKLEPFFALDPEYGVACCEKCHFKYGHNGECSTGHLARVDCK